MTTGVIATPPILQFTLNNGQLAAGGSILTQVGGINAATYQDSGLTTPLPNPIPLNSRGEVSNASGASCQLFLTPNTIYTFTLSDAGGNQVWVATYVNGVQVAVTQSIIGQALYPQTTAESSAGVTPSNYVYAPGFVDRYGTNTTPGTTDMTSAINAAIAVAFAGGGIVYFGPFTYAHSGTIVWKNGIVYQGVTNTFSKLVYTGPAADQSQINNPINSSTIANIHFKDLWFHSNTATALKANIADIGSTFLYFDNCLFSGAMIAVILDQSEIVDFNNCLFQNIVANANATAVWMVNGSEHTPFANAGFTNRITFNVCQFNSPSTLPYLVADDGGQSRKYVGCNFNGGVFAIRLNATSGVSIDDCEIEADSSGGFEWRTTKWGGNAGANSVNCAVRECAFSTSAQPCFKWTDANSLLEFIATGNVFTTTGAVFSGTDAGVVRELFAQGNEQGSSGDGVFLINNYFSAGTWNSTWASTAGSPAIGNGTLTTTFSRKGKDCFLRVNWVAGSTTTFGTAGGVWSFTIPVQAANDGVNYIGSVRALNAGVVPPLGQVLVGNNATTLSLINGSASGSWGQGTPGTWTTSDNMQFGVNYKAAKWLG